MKCGINTSLFCSIGRTMRSITILLEQGFDQADIDINLPQFIILNILSKHEDMILEDLSKKLHKDKSAVMRHINHLECNFWVAKITDKEDKRRKVLMLTQKGIKLLALAKDVENELQTKLTANHSNEEIVNFKCTMEDLLIKTNSLMVKLID